MNHDAATGQIHELKCLELWGGSHAAEEAASVPGIDVFVRSRPHDNVAEGGDIYYVSMCAAGKLARFALADVAGHGESVAHISRTLRDLLRKHINTADLTRLTRRLNREFERQQNGGVFATALLATYFAPASRLILVNAGHPPPLLYSSARRAWTLLDEPEAVSDAGIANLPLGIIEPTEYSQFVVPLEDGDVVLMYTDAAVEAADAGGRQIGTEGLLELASGLDAGDPIAMLDRIADRLDEHRGGAPANDDQTLIALRHNGSGPMRQPLKEKVRVMSRMLGLGGVELTGAAG